MIKSINCSAILLICLCFLLHSSCKKTNIEKILCSNNFKYWRIYENDTNNVINNSIVRFDVDGSIYQLFFFIDDLSWNLGNDINYLYYNSGNYWIYKNDSINLFNKTWHCKFYNINTDSVLFMIERNKDIKYVNKEGESKDSTISISYILYPYIYQIDLFDFDIIKNKKGTNYYFDKKLRNQEIKKWQ